MALILNVGLYYYLYTMKWKIIKQNPEYEVSDTGLVRRVGKQNPLKPWLLNTGYLRTSLGRGVRVKVHRVVAEAFIPNPDQKSFVNHKNGVKTDNRVENLEWVTRSENMQHAWDNGLMNPKYYKGAEHHNSKRVTATKNGEILHFNSCREAAKYFGGCDSFISQASRGTAGRKKNSNKAYGWTWG